LREEANKKIVPYYEQVQQLALPGPSGEQPPEIVSNMNKGFTSGDLAILPKYKLPLPSNVLMETLKDSDLIQYVKYYINQAKSTKNSDVLRGLCLQLKRHRKK